MQKLEVRLLYRLFEVKTTYNGQPLQKPLTAQNRAYGGLRFEDKIIIVLSFVLSMIACLNLD